MSEATKRKISQAKRGVPQSDEHKRNISLSVIGNKHWSYGKKNPLKTRIKRSLLYRRENCCHWQGGISGEENLFRHSLEYRLWREAVLKRDNSTCQGCGIQEKIMHVHHIKGFDEYPELRLAIDNGMVLCPTCHKKLPRNRKRLTITYSQQRR